MVTMLSTGMLNTLLQALSVARPSDDSRCNRFEASSISGGDPDTTGKSAIKLARYSLSCDSKV